MTEQGEAFAPDWVSPPGETLLDIIEERNWSQSELASRLGYTNKHISQLINGKVPLSVDAALRLERVLGASADFWLEREASYQRHTARLDAIQECGKWVDWLDELPVKELMATQAIPKRRLIDKNKPSIVASCLQFFSVASPDEWRAQYGAVQANFRRSDAHESDTAAVISWLRLGEQIAEKQAIATYDEREFEYVLSMARGLTRFSPQEFYPRLIRMLADAGVLLVLVPSIPKARVSGVARWLKGNRPVIQLSLYGKTNDKFWFNLFHEAAHLLLHGNTKSARQSVFLDNDGESSSDPVEQEANQWAADFLVPSEYKNTLSSLRTKAAVKDFSDRIDIHPGIVVGRLQHDDVIPLSWMNGLKESFRFIDS